MALLPFQSHMDNLCMFLWEYLLPGNPQSRLGLRAVPTFPISELQLNMCSGKSLVWHALNSEYFMDHNLETRHEREEGVLIQFHKEGIFHPLIWILVWKQFLAGSESLYPINHLSVTLVDSPWGRKGEAWEAEQNKHLNPNQDQGQLSRLFLWPQLSRLLPTVAPTFILLPLEGASFPILPTQAANPAHEFVGWTLNC